MVARKSSAPASVSLALPQLIKPDPNEPKTGCMWCPLLTFAPGFESISADYKRNAEVITRKLHYPHANKHHNISQQWTPVDVMFVFDTPSEAADSSGRPDAGGVMGWLKTILEGVLTTSADRIAISFVTRCRAPRGREATKLEVNSCSPELLREIEVRKPRLLVVFGNAGLELLTGHTGITTYHGQVVRNKVFPDIPILASMSPGYVMRMDHETERFCNAMITVEQLLTGKYEYKQGAGNYVVLDDVDVAIAWLEHWREEKKLLAFDTETGSLSTHDKRYPGILCFSFSNEIGTGYVIPFDHVDSPWSVEKTEHAADRERLMVALRELFTDAELPKIAHNEKFDRQHIRSVLGVDIEGTVLDTMLIHFVLDDRPGTHGLKNLASAYTGMGWYDDKLIQYKEGNKSCDPEEGGSYANVPGTLLFPYAAMDVDVTLRVYAKMQQDEDWQKNERFRTIAQVFLPRLSRTLADMEERGARVDPANVKVIGDECLRVMADTESKILTLPRIRQFVADQIKKGKHGKRKKDPFEFNPGSDQQLRTVFFEYYKCRPTELTDTGLSVLTDLWVRANRKDDSVGFTEIVNQAIEKKQWQYFSVKADVLQGYDQAGNDLASLILTYRENSKLYGTFVEPLTHSLDENYCVHGSFFIHGTVTGRLSSAKPNLQNIPGDAKGSYVSRFGEHGILLNADYSQIELRVAACYFCEPTMVKAYRDGADLHTLTAIDISGLSSTAFFDLPKTEQKAWRTRAKRVNFGILYGGGPPALQSTLKKDGVFLSIEECQALIDRYFTVRPRLKRGIDQLGETTTRRGFLDSFVGRRRRVPQVFSEDRSLVSRALRQSVNFPIQSGAADMTLMSLVLINEELERRKMNSMVVLTVHDSIISDCRVDEFLEVGRVKKYVMENINNLSDAVMPGIDWRWLTVPLVAEFDAGTTWKDTVEFNPDTLDPSNVDGTELLWDRDEKGSFRQKRHPLNYDELWTLMGEKIK